MSVRSSSTSDIAPAGYRLGDPIALEDVLALPADGRHYERDAEGRLTLVSPDSPQHHRLPLGRLLRRLNRALDAPYEVLPEPSIALPRLMHLRGEPIPASRLGPRSIEPDVAVFSGQPGDQATRIAPERLLTVVEIISDDTFRSDLGLGRADQVDRWRSYLESGVPEYWILNVGVDGAPLPPRSGMFLRNDGGVWRALHVQDAATGGTFRDLPIVTAGTVRSSAIPLLTVELEAFWRDCVLDAGS